MKQLLYLALALVIISCKKDVRLDESITVDTTAIISGKPTKATEPIKNPESIAEIKAAYSEIIAAASQMDSTSFTYDCDNEKSGKVTYFFENGNLKMVHHSYSEYSHFSATEQFYVANNAVFFALRKETVWSFVTADQTKDQVEENRYYIINGTSEKCLQKKYTILANSGIAQKPTGISELEIECPTDNPITEQFELLRKYSGQKISIKCLE